jgi:hypothetical protein
MPARQKIHKEVPVHKIASRYYGSEWSDPLRWVSIHQ